MRRGCLAQWKGAGHGDDEITVLRQGRSARCVPSSRKRALSGIEPAMNVMPSVAALPAAAIVTIRRRSRTSSRDTSTASVVPTASSAAAIGSPARSRTRPASPGPYSTGMPPKPSHLVEAGLARRSDDADAAESRLLQHTHPDSAGSAMEKDRLPRRRTGDGEHLRGGSWPTSSRFAASGCVRVDGFANTFSAGTVISVA